MHKTDGFFICYCFMYIGTDLRLKSPLCESVLVTDLPLIFHKLVVNSCDIITLSALYFNWYHSHIAGSALVKVLHSKITSKMYLCNYVT